MSRETFVEAAFNLVSSFAAQTAGDARADGKSRKALITMVTEKLTLL